MRSAVDRVSLIPKVRGFKLVKWDGNPPAPGEAKLPAEVILGKVDEGTQELVRPAAFRHLDINDGDNDMIRVKAPFSVNNGYETAEPDEMIAVSPEQARKILVLGGNVVNKEGEALALAQAAQMLSLTVDDLPAAEARSAREAEIAAALAA